MQLRAVAAALFALAAYPARAQIGHPVSIDGGAVAGVPSRDSAVVAFRGIPFAAPPTGDLRWKAPQPVAPWHDVRKAEAFAPICPQIRPPDRADRVAPAQSEDCLYLNVWTGAKSDSERRPVMVWIYGGGYRAGSTTLPSYDGTALAGRGVVFVSIAYRVGPLGFLAHPGLSAESQPRVSGNYGLLDQLAALDWVHRNIGKFGGDPNRITIFGQSAGSISTSYLAASPLATGRFHRLIGETGAGFGMLAPAQLATAEQKGESFGKLLGADTIGAMRALSAEQLIAAAGTESGVFQPINDGWVVPGDLETIYREIRQNDVAMLIGSNAEEIGENPRETLANYNASLAARYGADANALLALHPATDDGQARAASRQLGTIALGDYTMYRWARAATTSGHAPVYTYRFTRRPPIPPAEYPGGPDAAPPGAWHGAEIVYALDNLATRDWPWTATDRRLADILASYWVNFASNGDPNGPGLPHWPGFREDPGKVMELGDQTRPITRPHVATLDILNRHLGKPGY